MLADTGLEDSGLGLKVSLVIITFILGGLFWKMLVAPSSFPSSSSFLIPPINMSFGRNIEGEVKSLAFKSEF